MDHNSELEYIGQVINGETRLYAYFLQEYSDQVYRMIKRIIGSPEESEELTQDVFLKAYGKLSSFNGDSRFSTWLLRIAYNMAISAVRKKRVIYPVIKEEMLDLVADNDVDLIFDSDPGEELLLKLEKAVTLLPPEENVLLSMYYNEDRSVNDIASILGQSESNVKIRLYRIRKKLFLMVKQEEDEQG